MDRATRAETVVQDDLAREWLVLLAQVLWKLRLSDLDATELGLRIVGRLCIRFPHAAAECQAAFVPLFCAVVRGGKRVFGPFLDLPAGLQRLALSALFYLPSLSPTSCASTT